MQTEVRANAQLPVRQAAKGGVYRRYIKRPMDFILSLCAIIVLSPVLFITAVLVRVKLGSPVIFKQKRPGLKENIFTLYKFKTMTDKSGESGELLPDEMRLTRFGKLLRSTSLDELPELFNILKGDMSIIGPRPALWNQYDLIAERDKYGANDIRPGLSSWAAINGRDTLEINVKAKFDGEYVEKMSFAFDVKCILGTIITVLTNAGVVEGGTGGLEIGKRYALKACISKGLRDLSRFYDF